LRGKAALAVTGPGSAETSLIDRLLTPINRIQTLNHLDTLTPEIVDAARETLIIGR
jgi:hypothetical protein